MVDFKGRKELLIHINKEPRHSATYKWTFDEGLEIYEYYG